MLHFIQILCSFQIYLCEIKKKTMLFLQFVRLYASQQIVYKLKPLKHISLKSVLHSFALNHSRV